IPPRSTMTPLCPDDQMVHVSRLGIIGARHLRPRKDSLLSRGQYRICVKWNGMSDAGEVFVWINVSPDGDWRLAVANPGANCAKRRSRARLHVDHSARRGGGVTQGGGGCVRLFPDSPA